jgi:hypothetical protein
MKWNFQQPYDGSHLGRYYLTYPEDGKNIEVLYVNGSTNKKVWFRNQKFVNRNGFELFNIIAWRDIR